MSLTFFDENNAKPFAEVRDMLDKHVIALAMVIVTKDGTSVVLNDGASVPEALDEDIIVALENLIGKIKRGEARPKPGDYPS